MHSFLTLAFSILLATGVLAQSYGGASGDGGGSNSGYGSASDSGYGVGSGSSSGSGLDSSQASSASPPAPVATPPPSPDSPMPAGTVNVHIVKVSNKNGDLTFEPNDLNAAVGSMVQFHFYPKNHSIVESTFDEPCVPINNVKPEEPGLFSGFMPVKAGAPDMPAYTIMINDTKPIWYYCSQGDHCQDGMVGVINAPAKNASRSITTFAALAKNAPDNISPSVAALGGISSSSGSSSSGSSGSSGNSGSSGSSGSSDSTPSSSTGSNTNSTTPTAGVSATPSGFTGSGNTLASRRDLITGIGLTGLVGMFVAFA